MMENQLYKNKRFEANGISVWHQKPAESSVFPRQAISGGQTDETVHAEAAGTVTEKSTGSAQLQE
jgi:hypothetical protein